MVDVGLILAANNFYLTYTSYCVKNPHSLPPLVFVANSSVSQPPAESFFHLCLVLYWFPCYTLCRLYGIQYWKPLRWYYTNCFISSWYKFEISYWADICGYYWCRCAFLFLNPGSGFIGRYVFLKSRYWKFSLFISKNVLSPYCAFFWTKR